MQSLSSAVNAWLLLLFWALVYRGGSGRICSRGLAGVWPGGAIRYYTEWLTACLTPSDHVGTSHHHDHDHGYKSPSWSRSYGYKTAKVAHELYRADQMHSGGKVKLTVGCELEDRAFPFWYVQLMFLNRSSTMVLISQDHLVTGIKGACSSETQFRWCNS